MKKEKISPIQIGCAEIPIRTNVIETRSKSERGRSAERMPTGRAINIQTMIPPKASEAVTGALPLLLRRASAGDLRGDVVRDQEEDDERDNGDGEEQNHRPEDPSDQIPEHGLGPGHLRDSELTQRKYDEAPAGAGASFGELALDQIRLYLSANWARSSSYTGFVLIDLVSTLAEKKSRSLEITYGAHGA